MQKLIIGVCLFLSCCSYVACLECYECTNVEVKSSGWPNPFTGKSDPSCGSWPTSGNTVTCNDDEACGSISGDLSVMGGLFKASVQIRGCLPSDGSSKIGGCTKTDSLTENIISRLLGYVVRLPGLQFSGSLCKCGYSYCSLCDGGVVIGGYCMKYWMLGLVCVGILAVIIGIISCCCCCCGCCTCCKKSAPVVVYSYPYQPLHPGEATHVSYPPLSVQSGDIIRQPTNHGGPVGGAYPAYTAGFVEGGETAGYNQGADRFGDAVA